MLMKTAVTMRAQRSSSPQQIREARDSSRSWATGEQAFLPAWRSILAGDASINAGGLMVAGTGYKTAGKEGSAS
ncbi:hypothetical protein [Rhizobium laguerreae]|uniref:hypothetical protein n=1 Tax=Rhizobium laguerreae TaxID=1076926 RepID=UPI001C900224|nr:hypothetical protein [Rhizobium laguerreae]MBY3559048.1 hypothetical protein [Rhizobium laguerreae]